MFIELIPPLVPRDVIINSELITSIEKSRSSFKDEEDNPYYKYHILIYLKDSLFNNTTSNKTLNNNHIALTFENEDERNDFYKELRNSLDAKMLQGQP